MEFKIIKMHRNVTLEKILGELDELYEDLDYYKNSTVDIEIIKLKIKVREELLSRLSSINS